jgi:hypothetical protein
MYTLLTLLFTAVILGGLIWAYIHHLGEKGEKLKLINQGICPECKQQSIEVVDQKGGGCSGTAFVQFHCTNCDYTDSFNIGSGGCGSGSCKV